MQHIHTTQHNFRFSKGVSTSEMPYTVPSMTTGTPIYDDFLTSKQEIWNISEDIQLKQPLTVTVTYEDETVIAFSEDLSLWTEGETRDQAVAYLQEEIYDLYQSLLEDKEVLGPFPKKCLDLLQKRITANE